VPSNAPERIATKLAVEFVAAALVQHVDFAEADPTLWMLEIRNVAAHRLTCFVTPFFAAFKD
jgi:hypothetical protein